MKEAENMATYGKNLRYHGRLCLFSTDPSLSRPTGDEPVEQSNKPLIKTPKNRPDEKTQHPAYNSCYVSDKSTSIEGSRHRANAQLRQVASLICDLGIFFFSLLISLFYFLFFYFHSSFQFLSPYIFPFFCACYFFPIF